MSRHHRAQPVALLRNGDIHASPEFGFHLAQLGLQPLPSRLPQHRKPSAARLPTDMGETEEVEGFGLPLTPPLPVLARERAELQKTGFLGMQLQAELPKTFGQFLPATLGIRLVLEAEQSDVERIQRIMRAAFRSKAVREAEEVSFVDGVQHLDRGALEQLIFQRRHSERPLPPVSLGYVHPPHRLGPVRSTLDPLGEVAEVFLRLLAVVPPRLPVHARRRLSLEAEVGGAQRLEVADMVQERGEPHLPIPNRSLTYPLQRTERTLPALNPGRVLLGQVPFSQSPSLHPLRRRLPDLVRRLHRYYGTVRLPELVHRRRTSLDFPTRPAAPSAAGEPRASRFSCEVFPYVHGVCDRAGPERISRYRCARWCLALISTASASRSVPSLSRLNTRPARTPVNASTLPLRATSHDSGPLWVGRVRWWRGSGLRMMPTFPPPPLKFRTAGFPQYGFKAGISDGAFPCGAEQSRRPVCPRPSCSPLASLYTPYCAGARCALEHHRASGLCRSTPGALAPVRVILSRSITAYSAPSAPLAGTSRLRRLATYTRCLRCALAPRRPTSGSVLSLYVPSRRRPLRP